MMYFLLIWMLICVASLALCGYMLARNVKVAQLRLEIIDKIFSFSDFQWRREVYKTVSYDKMLLQIWKPVKVESFYQDLSFIKRSAGPVLSFYQPSHH